MYYPEQLTEWTGIYPVTLALKAVIKVRATKIKKTPTFWGTYYLYFCTDLKVDSSLDLY